MSDLASFLRGVMLVGFGTLEGYAFATSGMAYPTAFRGQMNFSKQLLLQVFVGAVSSSMLVQGLMSLLHFNTFDNSRVWKYTSVGFRRVTLGCLLLGSGMAIAGSGPTMLPSQLGVGTTSAFWILGGCIAGGGLFSILEQAGHCSTNFEPKKDERLVLDEMFGGHYAQWTLTLGTAMLAACAALPRFIDVSGDQSSLSPLLTTSPLVAGLSVGLNQIPVRVLSECGQGGSRAIMQIVAAVTGGKLANRFKVKSISCTNQLLYVWVGTMMGALYASRSLQLPAPPGYSPAESFVGGALMIFGARLAAGCACGHGVSGFSELGLQSIAGAAAMFAGGIATVWLTGLKP